ncbi:MAG: lipopolysaccharide heptosyltransferase II [Methylacidiphilales bacterium]|nr:lipopolysaccharide heptosyltransferase II [Candidatus Methylacidiphilales bacterium]
MPELENLGQRILLRSPNWLGDAIMTLPALQALQSALPNSSELFVLCPEKLADLWRLVPGLKNVLTTERSILATSSELRDSNFDSAILFPNSLRTALEARLACIPRRFGFTGHFRSWLLTQSWPRPRQTRGFVHHQKHYLALMKHLGVPVDETPFKPLPKPACVSPGAKPCLAVCPGAEYGPAKRWLPERFAETIRRILKKQDLEVVLLGGPKDKDVAEEFRNQADFPVTDKIGKTGLCEFLNIIAHAKLVLCNDSGAMHAAALFGTPAVAIFGSTEPKLTGPLGNSVAVLREHVPCSPCFLRKCPIDFRCMNAVTPDQAVEAALARI